METVTISKDTMNAILNQLDSFMRLMRYGGEYYKIVVICRELKEQGVNVSQFYYPNYETKESNG